MDGGARRGSRAGSVKGLACGNAACRARGGATGAPPGPPRFAAGTRDPAAGGAGARDQSPVQATMAASASAISASGVRAVPG